MTADEIRKQARWGDTDRILAEIAAQLADLNAKLLALMTEPDAWGGPPRFRINNDASGPEQ